jgi:ribonuclease R
MQSILLEKGVAENFPEGVLQDAKKIDRDERSIDTEERNTRRDFSLIPTFTIDPKDAKDFDDAISIKHVSGDTYEIGVHIADVSHYVRPGTALDEEALKRATSIYMVDRVIPMLPEILSNDLCSLMPKVERRSFSAVFEINTNGEVLSRWFGKSIINSHHRFSYEEAQEVLDGTLDIFKQELLTLNKIAYKLREKKFKDGAIDFDTEEVKFVLDEKGVPLSVMKKIRGDTHKLVEDFMLLANREVAAFISEAHEKKGLKGIYRVHDMPTEERLADLTMLYKALGYEVNKIKTAKDITELLARIIGKPEESLLKTATIRSMAKAIYATANTGHFGLAFKFYTHFTSPIRRYPDLEVHRLLQAILTHDTKSEKHELTRLEHIAKQSSEREVVAADAERTSIKYKQVEYMSKFIGQEFDGIITGVTEWGVYIEEKETKCEGMARLKDMQDDRYEFQEKLYRLVGQRTKKVISLGDSVRFRVVAANLETRTLDYALVANSPK